MYQEIFRSWQNFRRGKKSTSVIDAFEYDLFRNLRDLTHEIETGNYRHGNYRRVIIEEKKRRDLSVADVRDRVIHRLIYDELTEIFDKTFDPDVWSCRKSKGLHKCLDRTQELLRKHQKSFIWRMDITKFFDHVDHEVLKQCIKRRVKNPRIIKICDEIINSYKSQERERERDLMIENMAFQLVT